MQPLASLQKGDGPPLEWHTRLPREVLEHGLQRLEVGHLGGRHLEDLVAHALQRGAAPRLHEKALGVGMERHAVDLEVDLLPLPQAVGHGATPARQPLGLRRERNAHVELGRSPALPSRVRVKAHDHGCLSLRRRGRAVATHAQRPLDGREVARAPQLPSDLHDCLNARKRRPPPEVRQHAAPVVAGLPWKGLTFAIEKSQRSAILTAIGIDSLVRSDAAAPNQPCGLELPGRKSHPLVLRAQREDPARLVDHLGHGGNTTMLTVKAHGRLGHRHVQAAADRLQIRARKARREPMDVHKVAPVLAARGVAHHMDRKRQALEVTKQTSHDGRLGLASVLTRGVRGGEQTQAFRKRRRKAVPLEVDRGHDWRRAQILPGRDIKEYDHGASLLEVGASQRRETGDVPS